LASAFAHALTAYTLGKIYPVANTWKFLLLGMFCSVIPDADVIAFPLGIPYENMWGHRGFTHSILFAVLLGILVTLMFYSSVKLFSKMWLALVLYFVLCTLSHSLLDAMTTGGLGVAFFAPFDNNRYFLPWRPIKVSPIGVGNFLSEWGLRVIKSELLWVGLPCLIVLLFAGLLQKSKKRKAGSQRH
jgi:inner membrane protein